MALYGAFSVGRFKCSGALPKIGVADLLCDGYVLKVTKNSARTFCLNCIRDFCVSNRLKVTEDAGYLTISSLCDVLKDTLENRKKLFCMYPADSFSKEFSVTSKSI